MGLLFFAIGYFDFFDVLGLRLIVQALLLGSLFVVALPNLLIVRKKALREPLFLLALTFMLAEMLSPSKDTWLTAILGMGVTAVLLLLVFSSGPDFASQILKWLIVIAGFFATLGVVQFFLLLQQPEFVEYTINPNYVNYIDGMGGSRNFVSLSGGDFQISHPITLLGMTTGEEFFLGIKTPRIFSFAREPGLLIMYFFLPGVLALTYRSGISLLAIPLFAVAFLGFTGTVYASVLCAMAIVVAYALVKGLGKPGLLTWVLLGSTVLAASLMYWSTYFDDLLFVLFRNDLFQSNIRYLGFLDTFDSALVRLEQLRSTAPAANALGIVTGHIPGATGWIAYGLFKASILGALLVVMALYQIFKAASAYLLFSRGSVIAWALLCGIYMQVGFFQQYGFTLPAGFLITALTLERVRHLAIRKESRRLDLIHRGGEGNPEYPQFPAASIDKGRI
jgi:hypothetical protein